MLVLVGVLGVGERPLFGRNRGCGEPAFCTTALETLLLRKSSPMIDAMIRVVRAGQLRWLAETAAAAANKKKNMNRKGKDTTSHQQSRNTATCNAAMCRDEALDAEVLAALYKHVALANPYADEGNLGEEGKPWYEGDGPTKKPTAHANGASAHTASSSATAVKGEEGSGAQGTLFIGATGRDQSRPAKPEAGTKRVCWP